MNYIYIVSIQSVYICISLVFYFSIFFYILMSRDPEFRTAFHRLFLLRAPADFFQVLISLIAFRFPIAGFQAVTYIPHLAKIGFVISQYSVLVEMCAQLLLSANRLSAIVYPIQHNKLWTRKYTLTVFLIGMAFSLIPTASRLTQPAAYMNVNGSYIPHLVNPGDQEANSKVTVSLYVFFCVSSLICNILAGFVHKKQKRMQFFETQPKLASTVQTNLLIYAAISTGVVVLMTCFQLTLAFHVFDIQTDAHRVMLVCLTFAADAFALSNPYLLFCLSNTFRQKILPKGRIRSIFADCPSTNETI